jgi:two-component system sensor histidine kinase DctS
MPQPFQPRAGESVVRRSLWLLPGLLALVFVAVIARWADVRDSQEHTNFQLTLLADASSVEVQLNGRKDAEQAKLREAAGQLPSPEASADAALAAMPEVVAGLDRLWNRLVWLDADNQVLARAARKAPMPTGSTDTLRIQSKGQAEHFVEPVPGAAGKPHGQLLARYDLTDLLQSTDLAWLTRRYEVSFITDLGEVIATTASLARAPEGVRYERPLPGFKDTTLRLTPYDALVSWRQNTRMLALLAGLLLLGAAASQLLRAEMRRVRSAVAVSQSEAAWRKSMEDSALVGLRARDLAGRILYVNKTLCDLVGYRREELVGLLPPLPFWPPESVDDMMARNQMALEGQAPRIGTELRWRHREGHPIEVMLFESPLVNALGRHVGWMGSVIDINERKRLEERDRRHTDLLAQHARLNDMGLLASELAHELNQPLTTIVGYSAGLKLALEKRPPVDPDLMEAVAEVHRHARKAGDIVNWIRKKASRSEAVRSASAANTVVSDALKRQQRQIARAGIVPDIDLALDLPQVIADPLGIELVVTNLIRNAVDALSEHIGERRIVIATHREQGGVGQAERVCITVQDNGPGLQGRTIDALCATFFTTKPHGMGLGLGICRSIAESHGGSLTATEAAGGGAQFVLSLPASADSSGAFKQ